MTSTHINDTTDSNAGDNRVIPQSQSRTVKSVPYPTDKPSRHIWDLSDGDTIAVDMRNSKDKVAGKPPICTICTVDFSELPENLTITRELTPYDKRVYLAVAALYEAGNEYMTVVQIHHTMGGIGDPAPHQRQRIDEALTKLMSARIHIDNAAEATAYRYQRFRYDGAVLEAERVTAVVNGNLTTTIHVAWEPRLVTFARGRIQITSVDIRLLQGPLRQTDRNLAIEDYLILRVSKAKRDRHTSVKVLWDTLYKRIGVTDRKQRSRMRDSVCRCLDHYRSCDYIRSYTTSADGVSIRVD